MKQLRQISIIGLGLLGSSVSLAVLRTLSGVKTVGYGHHRATREKAARLGVVTKVVDDIRQCVSGADIVIVATPIRTFESIFFEIADVLKDGCTVTDVGSTKTLAHRWAEKALPGSVYYAGSHPIAGSEQRGAEFARDDLLYGAGCIITATRRTNARAVRNLKQFWSLLGCCVKVMTPGEHDRIFANVSHLPHVAAAALMNASNGGELKFAGTGFVDTTRVASGPANVWVDILLTNAKNSSKAIDRLVGQLRKLQKAVDKGDEKQVQRLLEQARSKRATLIKYKMRKKEID